MARHDSGTCIPQAVPKSVRALHLPPQRAPPPCGRPKGRGKQTFNLTVSGGASAQGWRFHNPDVQRAGRVGRDPSRHAADDQLPI